jgi:uncharacterized delta-60 repeat protein
VTNIAVHCTTVAPSPGLDTTFGDGGRVSTAVGGGQGNAVVIQPSGGIVSAGFRTVGAGTDFALTRHDPNGALDTSFGTNGIATTDVGGVRDQAHDAALTPDGGIIAAGETDAAGVQKQDFALVRYNPDGTLNTSFGNGGIVTTDISGRADIADAVAVQVDGKILAAGLAVGSSGVGTDFVLARYNPGGSLDTSFGTNGTVTIDFGVLSHDGATAIAIQPDGKIVVTGVAGEDIALVRYTIDGHLDPTFGNAGTLTTDLGFVDVANGVALTPDGHIVVAGYTIGPKANNDFLLVRYTADGNQDRLRSRGGLRPEPGHRLSRADRRRRPRLQLHHPGYGSSSLQRGRLAGHRLRHRRSPHRRLPRVGRVWPRCRHRRAGEDRRRRLHRQRRRPPVCAHASQLLGER